ncbi:hypothetical protein ACVJGD_002764 [Bradyrhizobium sp. USDA 10063]
MASSWVSTCDLSKSACVEHGGLDIGGPPPYSHVARPFIPGVWLWFGSWPAVVGVTIGDGPVVGAGAVVTRDVPPVSIAVGWPAIIFQKSN